ncbi:putative lipid-A-disaccharide synthase, mitochondrial [Apostasia shenzhenica]|uniref:lipid-A-disaccharide synthase n=1 Tax=Apostasia shenzhenica TaxID=1088818 RepID=A0A2I0AQY2_9ASPA|nr:putative lipid-A-disaccharide synthase, mitochondrial [Apostasia shenzhenica]
MASLKRISSFPVRFAGVGGSGFHRSLYSAAAIPLMCQEGLQSLFPMEDIAVMGIFELLPYLKKIRVRLKDAIDAAMLFQPHVVVTVDSKGFSFRLLNGIKARHTCNKDRPVHVHYVAPSFWAWKGGERRLGKLAEFIDHMLCILPFEEGVCRLNGIAASYIGHPLVEDVLHLDMELHPHSGKWRFQGNNDAFRQQHGIPPGNLSFLYSKPVCKKCTANSYPLPYHVISLVGVRGPLPLPPLKVVGHLAHHHRVLTSPLRNYS